MSGTWRRLWRWGWTGPWGRVTPGLKTKSTARSTAGCCRPTPTKSRPRPRREACRRYPSSPGAHTWCTPVDVCSLLNSAFKTTSTSANVKLICVRYIYIYEMCERAEGRTDFLCVSVCWSWGLWELETTTLRSRWWTRSTTTTPPRRWASTTKVRCVWWSTAAAEASDTRWPQVGGAARHTPGSQFDS